MYRIFIFLFLLSFPVCAQEHAWVYLDSKENVATYLANPLTMLSQKAIDRREAQGIAIGYSDVPITPGFITDISNAPGITYIGASKWFNAIHVFGSEADINALTSAYSYIESIEFADDSLNPSSLLTETTTVDVPVNKFPEETTSIMYNYGIAQSQMEMFKAHKLHEQGFTGEGMTIAVIDTGYPNVDTNAGFQHLRDNGHILGGYDFVNNTSNVYTGYFHGANVLSLMAGYYNDTNNYVGSAPNADYYLYVTEDIDNETPAEETYWVMAAEQADYEGVDIINTSLGYFAFDEVKYNYNYTTDLDGNTAFITRGAEMAFSKGLLLVTAAGNYGNNASWGGRISVPADAPNTIAVGAVNASGTYVSFSSKGPTSDNRIKPDVCVQGQGAAHINTSGAIATGDGTSYASPLLAGGIACLWQAFPNATNAEIVQMVKESASIYTTPNYTLGYGIPNLELAQSLSVSHVQSNKDIVAYPNPTESTIKIKNLTSSTQYVVSLFNMLGEKILQKTMSKHSNNIDLSKYASGVYFANIETENKTTAIKIIKE